MKPALTLTLTVTLAALALPACGGGATTTSKAATSPATGKPATAALQPVAAGTKASEPVTAKNDKAQTASLTDDGKAETINEAIKVLDDMPTQDDLDAAAAARINEGTADAEYQRLKAEIEADVAKPGDGG